MAIEFMRFKSVSSRSARLADYVLRNGEYEAKEADFLVGGSAGLPSWATSPHDFFKEAEKQEKGEIGKHVIIALPKEFNLDENKELSEELLQELFPSHTYVWGIHENIGSLSNEKNPHLHILVCDRKIEPERAEPTREIYFKKSRTLKTGEISGGYRKDDFLSGSQRQKGLLLKKKALEKVMNRHIQKHNEKTGENVRKISFEERHGKGERHLGKNAIAVGIKTRAKVIQSELDRRIEKEVKIQQKNVENAEKMAIKKCTNLYFEEKIVLNAKKAVNFVRYWGDKSKRKEENERIELDMHRGKLNDHQKQQIFVENRQNNEQIAGDRVLKKIETFNRGLQAEAQRRRIKNPVEYHSTNSTVKKFEEAKIQQEQERIRQEEENKRWEKQQKIAEEYQQRRAIFKENCNDGIAINGKIYRFKVVENWDFFELQRLYEHQKLEKMLDFAKEKGLLQEPEQPKFERQPERITPIRTTERTAERTPKKKNRGFER